MAPTIGSTSDTTSVTVAAATTNRITNFVSSATPDTEESHTLLADLKSIEIKIRGEATMKFSFVVGDTATKYITIPKNNTWSKDDLNLASEVLYFRVDKPSQTIEILEWA